MRILQVIAVMGQGGAERLALELTRDGVRRGDRMAIVAMPGDWAHRPQELGGDFFPMPLLRAYPVPYARSVVSIRNAIRSYRPDVAHAHNVNATVATRAAIMTMTGTRPALLTTLHGLPPEAYRRAAILLRMTTPNVIACSTAVGRRLTDHGYPAIRMEVIPNGARLEPADAVRVAAVRKRYDLGSRPTVVGVGRLVTQKQWETLIEATIGMVGVDVVVAGDGPLRLTLEQMARSRGGTVRFLGPVHDIAALLQSADCFVSTSFWEGLPLSLLEALSLGVPAVSTAVDGVVDVVSGNAALLVRPGDPRAIRESIERVLEDRELSARLSAAGRELSRNWAPERMLVRYRRAYERVIAGPTADRLAALGG